MLSIDGLTAPLEATLRGRVFDAKTGRLSACSVTIMDAEGRRVTETASFPAGFRCSGKFEKVLPSGRTRVRISRGPETRSFEASFELAGGEERELEVWLERAVDLRRRGWFAGDNHVHMIHGERTVPVDFDDVALAARAEDLQYLSLSHAWALEDATPERLEAELSRRSSPESILTWNLEAPKNYYRGDAGRCLGHCWSVGMRGRTASHKDVIPLLIAASAGDYASEKASFANFESHRLIRAQGGAVFYTHPARWWTGAWGGRGGYPHRERMRISNLAVELPLDTLVGPTFDGLDIITGAGELDANAAALKIWVLLLNHGYRLAATGSSDACFDRPGGAVPGAVRTYTFIEDSFSLAAVARATAAGRTFVTTGPLLLADLDGLPPGSSVPADGSERTLRLEAWSAGHVVGGVARIEVVRNGEVVRSFAFDQPLSTWSTNLAVSATETAWYHVRAYGDDPRQQQRAFTGAFFFDGVDYEPPASVPARVRVRLQDAETGEILKGELCEVAFSGPIPLELTRRELTNGEVQFEMDATHRVRAEVEGYESLTLSPFLDFPILLDTVTGLEADDLLEWGTFKRIRELLGDVSLVFEMRKLGH
jgi:hypothetical protein